MSRSSWERALARTLRRLRRPDRPARIAVVGVGHELCGDDAAGVLVARALAPLLQPQCSFAVCRPSSVVRRQVLVLDAGPAPENFTGALRRFGPDLVLLIDAARMDAPPATIEWLAWQVADALGASTHTLPLALFAGYLAAELGCETALLGIQPADTSLDAPLSPPVRQAVGAIARTLAMAFS